MKREREKELLFRGSQIKEAIENWYNPKYTFPGVPPRTRVHPLMDLKDLLLDPYSLSPIRYLPHHYSTELDVNSPKCDPDCARLKIYQDPMTGKEWTIIRGNVLNGVVSPNQAGGIVGVASKSEDQPFKSDFKDTALENMVSSGFGATTNVADIIPKTGATGAPLRPSSPLGSGGKTGVYSEWKFIADPKNDHTKIYRAYHEGW